MTDTVAEETDPAAAAWRDPALGPEARADALIARMTLQEKAAQLYGVWVGASAEGGEVAPHQHEMEEPVSLDTLLPQGLGQLTRPFGTAPVDPALGALSLLRTQRAVAAANRFGIPAVAHEECLAGFAAWGATAYPVPLAWGATFDPALVRTMAARIGRDLRSVGVHQGLAPVLDVVRDARWGRVEETIGEDPYLVGTVGTAYVQGLESAGIVATLKHFAGYSASRAGRNLAPVGMGERERADVMLAPFEMAVRESGARAVMHAYTDTDGIPSAADERLLTGLLRDRWGFTRHRRRRLLRHRLPQDPARGRRDARRGGRRGAGRGRGRRTADREDLRRAAAEGRRRRQGARGADRPRAAPGAGAEGPARPAGRRLGPGARGAGRRRPGTTRRRCAAASTSTPPTTARWPARSPSAASSCSATTASSRWAPPPGSRSSAPTPTPRPRSWAATPSPSTSAACTRTSRPASTCPPCARR